MTDIVEHLKECAKYAEEYPSDVYAFKAAATEITRLRAENKKLRVALISLTTTMDDFWNDKTLPSIAHMNEQTVRNVESAQRTAAAILDGETDD